MKLLPPFDAAERSIWIRPQEPKIKTLPFLQVRTIFCRSRRTVAGVAESGDPLFAATDKMGSRLLWETPIADDLGAALFAEAPLTTKPIIAGFGLACLLGQVATAPGARTSLFVPELDRLFVAARAVGREPAAIWVLRPMP